MNLRNYISSAETENFLKNLNSIMQENWISQNYIADKMYPVTEKGKYASTGSRAQFSNNLKKMREGRPPTLKFVNKVATALECSVESLLADIRPMQINKAGEEFADEAIRKGFTIQKLSTKTGIPQGDLARIINRGIDKFNVEQISRLLEKDINFKLPSLIPFAPKEMDIFLLVTKFAPVQPVNVSGSTLDWVYQRRAITLTAFYQGIDTKQLSQVTGLTRDYLEQNFLWKNASSKNVDKLLIPTEDVKKIVLSTLGLDNISKQNLIIMGKYSLTSDQLNELIQCEKLFKDYAQRLLRKKPGIAAIAGEDVYQFYLGMKHQYHSAGTAFSDAIPKVVKNIGWGKLVVFTSVLLTSLVKSIPVAAAEIVADFGIQKLDQNATQTEEQINKLLSVFSSVILKHMLLIPKGMSAAITTPFPNESNFFKSLLKLPTEMIERFIEADGYNEAIFDDWKEMAGIISRLMDQNQKISTVDKSGEDISSANSTHTPEEKSFDTDKDTHELFKKAHATLKTVTTGLKVTGEKLPPPFGQLEDFVEAAADVAASDSPITSIDLLCNSVNNVARSTASAGLTGGLAVVVATMMPTLDPLTRGTAAFAMGVTAQPAINEISKPVGNAAESVCRTSIHYGEKAVDAVKEYFKSDINKDNTNNNTAFSNSKSNNEYSSSNITDGSFDINFTFNGQHQSLNVCEGTEIYVSNKSTGVLSTSCQAGTCIVTMKLGPDNYKDISVPYKTNNHYNSRHDAITSSVNHRNGEIINSCVTNINSLQNSQRDLHTGISSAASNINLSQLSSASRPTITYTSAMDRQVALANAPFMFSSFKEPPPPQVSRSNYGFFNHGNNGGDSGSDRYCDSFGNCYSIGGGNDCRGTNSSKCESSLKF